MAKNTSASIRQRLLNLARERGENFDYVLKLYLIQRLLYRLSQSDFQDKFLLKGAMLFWVWGLDAHRPTRDIDLLGYTSNDIDTLVGYFQDICRIEADDGLAFELDSIKGVEIKEDALYQGVRITGGAELEKAKITFQVDIGFGDAVTPAAQTQSMMAYLDMPRPELKVYPVYTVIAEKFQAMVSLGLANSRIKDFYDVWVISREIDLEGALLAEAIQATFAQRQTPVGHEPLALFQTAFMADANKQAQWQAFLRKNGLASELTFEALLQALQGLLEPVYEAISKSSEFSKAWSFEQGRWQ